MATDRKKQSKALARMRLEWQRENDRKELARLRAAIELARARRRTALRAAKASCGRARRTARERVRAYRAAELARIKTESQRLRNAARAQCQARRQRISASSANAIEKNRAEARAVKRLQRQIERVSATAARSQRASAKERRQEDDGAVRGNLPAELWPVWERVKRHIKGGARTTRTEAFLEWAESHPEDVLSYQGDETDREVARLVREHETASSKLRKTRPSRRARVAGDVPF